MYFCDNCNSEVPFSDEKCPTCGKYIGPPNVRAVKSKEEIDALNARYKAAFENSHKNGSFDNLKAFEEETKKSCAVINCNLYYLTYFCTNDKVLYSNYSLQRKGQSRKAADEEDDKRRRSVEAMFFGDYAEEIRYAALSLNGIGLKSYGAYSILLKEIAIQDRATLLENNSYGFVLKKDLRAGDKIPVGFRSCWGDRHKLAVSKLQPIIHANTKMNEFAKILLKADSKNRANDEFIEVHIYGGFDNKAVESVTANFKSKDKKERAFQNITRDILKKSSVVVIEL